MSDCNCINAELKIPEICVETYPTGPRGAGIKEIKQEENRLTVTYEDGTSQVFELPDWWFGTRREYNGLSKTERTEKSLYFIEEGT